MCGCGHVCVFIYLLLEWLFNVYIVILSAIFVYISVFLYRLCLGRRLCCQWISLFTNGPEVHISHSRRDMWFSYFQAKSAVIKPFEMY